MTRLSGLGNTLGVEPAPALRTEDPAVCEMKHELTAGQTFQACATQERVELLLERAVERPYRHRDLKTPVTLPSTST